MTESKPTSAHRFHWRRLFQYRLRTLLILTTIIAVALGWWSHKARQQREAVAALEKVGARITYDTSLPGTGEMIAPPQWPQWLLNNVGVDYFASVEELSLSNTQATDTALEHLKHLTALQRLWLYNTQVTDSGLEHLKGLTALEVLSLSNTQATDTALEHLKHLTALQRLWLYNTQVTDSGLEHIKGLTALQELNLTYTQVTDAGIARLQKALPNCKIER